MAIVSRKEDYLFVRWAKEVKMRDHYTCVVCGRRGLHLESHHLNAWSSFPDERYDLDNGITLCKDHHDMFHEIYGKGENTKEQFEEFSKMMELMQIEAKHELKVAIAAKEANKLISGHQIASLILEELEDEQTEQDEKINEEPIE